MRKFKVWCNDHNEWEKDICVLDQNGTLLHMMGNGRLIPLKKESHIVYFSIEHLDKNGKELYENDFVRCETGGTTENGIRTPRYHEGIISKIDSVRGVNIGHLNLDANSYLLQDIEKIEKN